MLEARDLYKAYNHQAARLEVVKGLNLEIAAGEFVAVVGPSGAGKSTLLHLLGGLDRPTQGEVLMDGENIYRLKERARARLRNQQIGFIFQFYHLLAEFTALENVILPALIYERGGGLKQARERAGELLTQVGLGQRLTHRPGQLSGGEQQRVAIARALINDPRILFCDEPTGNLDSESGREIIDLLLGLNRQQGLTLVMVTHDEQLAARAGRIIRMRDGSLVDGPRPGAVR